MTQHSLHPMAISDVPTRKYFAIHTTEIPQLVEVLAMTPGYNETRAQFERLAAYQPERVELPPDPEVAMVRVILDALARGEEIPTDLMDAVPDGESVRRRVQAASNAKVHAREALQNNLDHLVPIAKLWGAAREALVDLVERAKGMLETGVPIDPDDAVEQDRVADYKHAKKAEAEYRELRLLQQRFTSGVVLDGDQRGNAMAWYVKDPVEYLDANRGHEVARVNGFNSISDLPDNWHEGPALWWFASIRATPWMPTAEEHKLALNVIREATESKTPKEATMSRSQASRSIAAHRNAAYWESQG